MTWPASILSLLGDFEYQTFSWRSNHLLIEEVHLRGLATPCICYQHKNPYRGLHFLLERTIEDFASTTYVILIAKNQKFVLISNPIHHHNSLINELSYKIKFFKNWWKSKCWLKAPVFSFYTLNALRQSADMNEVGVAPFFSFNHIKLIGNGRLYVKE